jgi:hypothetical protein
VPEADAEEQRQVGRDEKPTIIGNQIIAENLPGVWRSLATRQKVELTVANLLAFLERGYP